MGKEYLYFMYNTVLRSITSPGRRLAAQTTPPTKAVVFVEPEQASPRTMANEEIPVS